MLEKSERTGALEPDDISIVELVHRIVERALVHRASDVHIEPCDTHVRVRFRIDGSLVDVDRLPTVLHGPLISRLKILAGMNIIERRRPQDGQFSTMFADRTIDVRLATLSTIHGEKIVLRLLDQNRTTRGLGELGMGAATSCSFRQLIRSPFGLVLCAGPTGSGKTTTLYASLRDMDITGRNVTTIEDPVEYTFPGINQVKTNDLAGLTFATGLRALLRQDPDVILIGELRDEETARLGVQAALTGHFVLSSIHAIDATGAIQRLIDMGVESFLISSSLIAVIGQRLLRKNCPTCTTLYVPSVDELDLYRRLRSDVESTQLSTEFRRGSGCGACSETGFRERIGVYEILRISPGIRRLLTERASSPQIRTMALQEGMTSMGEAAMSLVQQGITTIDEVIRTLSEGVLGSP